jgi:hypothetical protein
LAALTTESCGQVAALSALQQHDRNQKETNDNVNQRNQNGHCKKLPLEDGGTSSFPNKSLTSGLPIGQGHRSDFSSAPEFSASKRQSLERVP